MFPNMIINLYFPFKSETQTETLCDIEMIINIVGDIYWPRDQLYYSDSSYYCPWRNFGIDRELKTL